jgi:hypothetical protein
MGVVVERVITIPAAPSRDTPPLSFAQRHATRILRRIVLRAPDLGLMPAGAPAS